MPLLCRCLSVAYSHVDSFFIKEPLGGGTFADHTAECGVPLEESRSPAFGCGSPIDREGSQASAARSVVGNRPPTAHDNGIRALQGVRGCCHHRLRASAPSSVSKANVQERHPSQSTVADRTIAHRPRAFIVVVLVTHTLWAGLPPAEWYGSRTRDSQIKRLVLYPLS